MTTNIRDMISGAVVLCLAAGLYSLSFTVEEVHFSGVGAQFMPRLIAVLFAVLGAALILTAARKNAAVKAAGLTPEKSGNDRAPNGYLLVLANIILFTLYLFCLEPVGFLIATTVYLFLQMLLLSAKHERRHGLFCAVSLLTSVASYYLFTKGFLVILPPGILG